MDGTRFRYVSESETNDHVSATFLLSPFRSFLSPLRFRNGEILPLRTIKVNKGTFTLEIGPLNGQAHTLNTRARCIDATTVR